MGREASVSLTLMSAAAPVATTYGATSTYASMPAYGGYTSSYGAMPTYGAASYGSYVPPASTGYSMPMSYGGYVGHGPAMDEDVVKTQLADAQKVLKTQFGTQTEMLSHQYTAQLNMLLKQKETQIKQMTMQYEQQYTQQKLAIGGATETADTKKTKTPKKP